MKNLYSFFIYCLVVNGYAQVINFPDPNFKTILLAADVTNTIAQNTTMNPTNIKVDTNNNGEIEVAEALNVEVLTINNCNLTSLEGIENFTNLIILNSNLNQLTSVDLTFRPYMYRVQLSSNLLIDVQLPPIVAELTISNNSFLETLRVESYTGTGYSTPPYFTFDCRNNTNLHSLFIKDAYILNILAPTFFAPIMMSNCPNLNYICANADHIPLIQTILNINGNLNCEVNSYCSYTLGGDFYTISGSNRLDYDFNGCDSNDLIVPKLKLSITNGTITGTIIPNASGSYSVPVQAGSHTITPILENPTYYTVEPSSTTVSFPAETSPFTQNFCIASNGNYNDLEVLTLPISPAVPGFNSYYKLIYKNKGTTIQSGTIQIVFDDAVMDFVSATPNASIQAINNLTWSFTNLEPFESRTIFFLMNLNSPTETPALNVGDSIVYETIIEGLNDETPIDNSTLLNQTVVNSFDPNDKICLEGTTITQDKVGEYVHYLIRFENNGTANAQNVVVKDMIDIAKFDIATLVPLDGSHSFVTRITNSNQVEFFFENIQLPFDDANNDGYVVFKIKTKPTLSTGSSFSNTASIYFDYNFPIVTNTATTTIQPLANQDFEFSDYFELAPNPAQNVLQIQSKKDIELLSISIYNTLGQLVLVIPNAKETTSIDVSQFTSGTYFVKVISDKGSSNSKFIKE